MRLSVEEAACQILQTVQRHLPQASVDHESLGGTHYFYIDHAGARFSVRFPEGALQRKQKAELQAAIHEVIEQVIGVSRRSPSKQFKSTLMLSFIESNPATVHRMAGEPTLRVLRP